MATAKPRTKRAVVKPNPVPKEIGTSNSSVLTWDYCLFGQGVEKDLQFPYNIFTFKQMKKNSAVAAALSATQLIALRVPRFITPYDDSETHKKRADFVNQCLGVTTDVNDMTHSFDDFIREALSMGTYGFAIHEIVFRRRLKKNGSLYDDGKIGLKRLPIRPQNSIEEFVYDDYGRELVKIKQRRKATPTHMDQAIAEISRKDLLVFKADCEDGNQQGVSPLVHVYDTWREIQKYKDLENVAASKNLNGLPVIYMPADAMTDDPTDEQAAIYGVLKDSLDKLAIGQQSGIILPSDRESLSGSGGKLYEIQLLSASSSSVTAISDIRQNLEQKILQTLFADGLQMGGERSGSTGLVNSKTEMLNMVVENRVKEIFSVINRELLPRWFEINGWDATKLPKLEYGTLDKVSYEEFAKAIQQTKATKVIPVTAKNINFISEKLGLPDRVPEDITQDALEKLLGVEDKLQSKSGTGYSSDTGGLSGQGNKPPEDDKSAGNLNNK